MSESDNWRKHELECMRLAADCMQLAGDVHSPALQSHFLRMARVWSSLADQGPSADTSGPRTRTRRSSPACARIRDSGSVRALRYKCLHRCVSYIMRRLFVSP